MQVGIYVSRAVLAVTTGVTAYDALYLALAVRLETQVVTADDRFGKASRTPNVRPRQSASST
jgi:predicted nucleic acid-binding protein